jgi:hypothetical protein
MSDGPSWSVLLGIPSCIRAWPKRNSPDRSERASCSSSGDNKVSERTIALTGSRACSVLVPDWALYVRDTRARLSSASGSR